MSWEAVEWANKQRLRLPQEQFILLLIANASDPDGVAFSWWKRKEHWWTYLQDHSRMSKASVFKHLNTIEGLGLGIRVRTPTTDGSIRAVMHLDLTKSVIINNDDDADQSQDTNKTESNYKTENIDAQSIHKTEIDETQSNDKTDSSPTVGPYIESKKESFLPPTPKGVVRAVDAETFEQDITDLAAGYPSPITNLPKVLALMAPMPHEKRQKVVLAAKGYADFLADCQRKRKPRSARDAHRWIAADEWTGFVMAGERAAGKGDGPQLYDPGSPAAKALRTLGAMARYTPLTMSDGRVSYKGEITARLLAMAEIDAETKFAIYKMGSPNFRAWRNFIIEVFKGCNLPDRMELHVPWPWPPKADGSIYSGSDPPPLVPGTLATDEDLAEMDIAKG